MAKTNLMDEKNSPDLEKLSDFEKQALNAMAGNKSFVSQHKFLILGAVYLLLSGVAINGYGLIKLSLYFFSK